MKFGNFAEMEIVICLQGAGTKEFFRSWGFADDENTHHADHQTDQVFVLQLFMNFL